MNLLLTLFLLSALQPSNTALQKSHEKSRMEKWSNAFIGKSGSFDHTSSLVNLLRKVADDYLTGCHTTILYDSIVDDLLLGLLLQNFPHEFSHGNIETPPQIADKCSNYLLFLADMTRARKAIGEQNENRVVVVVRSSQWRVHEFLSSEESHHFVNLLVVSKSDKIVPSEEELPYIFYTHRLYTDGLGSSEPLVLTSWRNNALTRPKVSLFPKKMTEGFATHRFICAVGHQPPFVIQRVSAHNQETSWDGLEIRLVNLLSKHYNFTPDFREAPNANKLGARNAVVKQVKEKRAEIGLSGLYVTNDIIGLTDISNTYTTDCAAFVSLTSTALPRYRAIMGPFHWKVWMTLTLVYLLAIFPLAFSDKHTLKHLLKTPEEIENMFWYVFGTFTNCFSFGGKNSWNKSEKVTTRLLVGFYWVFTIIISACYTGSIIAFVTLPVYPQTVDTIRQLLDGGYKIGILDKGGWESRFRNLSDPDAEKLMMKKELVPTIEMGLKNTTKAFFWNYAFLGSKAELDYIVRTNFTTTNKRSVLHISSECFLQYSISMAFAPKSNYKSVLDEGIARAAESGLMVKFIRDIEWEFLRSATGKLLQVSTSKSKALTVEDRALTLDDTQGMFLLLGIGFLLGGASLVSEVLGGCFNFCKRKVARRVSIASNPRSHDIPTPREKQDSLKMNDLHFGSNGRPRVELEKREEEDEETVDCVIHNERISDEEIDEMFDFESMFGERNVISAGRKEDIKNLSD